MISRLIDVRKNSFENIDGVVEGHIFTFIVPSAANKYAPTTVQFYAMAFCALLNLRHRYGNLAKFFAVTHQWQELLCRYAIIVSYKYSHSQPSCVSLYSFT